MLRFLGAIDWKTVSAVASPFISAAIALFILRSQRKQDAARNRLELLDRRLDIYTKTLQFCQALFDSPEFIRSPAFSAIHREFILAMKRSKMLFNSEVAGYLERINLEAFKIKGSKEFAGPGVDPHLVKSLFDDAMKAFATIEATMPQLEAAMSPYVELRN